MKKYVEIRNIKRKAQRKKGSPKYERENANK